MTKKIGWIKQMEARNLSPHFLANEIGLPRQQRREGHRKIMPPSDSSGRRTGVVDILHKDEATEMVYGTVWANVNNVPAGNSNKGGHVAHSNQLVHELLGPSDILIQQEARIEVPGALGVSDSLLLRRKASEERVEHVRRKMLKGS